MAEYFTAPWVTSGGSGTFADPWPLALALSKGPGGNTIVAGDTVSMRGGVYRGKFTSTLAGSAGNKITVRSAPGEWAVIDGFATTTLTADINASTQTVAFADASAFHEGASATIDVEQLSLLTKVGNSFTFAQRGINSTAARSHTAGSLVVLGGNNLTVNGSYTIYRDFEVRCSDPVRQDMTGNTQNAPRLRGACIFQGGPNTDLVNLVLHDGDTGVFKSSAANPCSNYGLIIYNVGYLDRTGGVAGHGLYGLHASTTNRYTVEACVSLNNFSMGAKMEAQTGDASGMDILKFVSFNNGSPLGGVLRNAALLLGANNGQALDDNLRDSVLANPIQNGHPLNWGYGGANGASEITGNIIYAGTQAVKVQYWDPLTFTGNKVYVTFSLGNSEKVVMFRITNSVTTWNNNEYYGGSNGGIHNFFYQVGSSNLGFAAWQAATGFDANSTHSTTTPPTGNVVVIHPNTYQTGRAHVTILNFDSAATVNVNLSTVGLTDGQSYVAREVQNLFGPPALTGVYNAASPTVAFPMTTLPAFAQIPVGWHRNVDSTKPRFACFLVTPVGNAHPIRNRAAVTSRNAAVAGSAVTSRNRAAGILA